MPSLDTRIAAAVAALEPDDRSPSAVRCLRGVRGLPSGRLAELVAEAYREDPPRLPEDRAELDRLWGVAWEDGLAAIGLAAAAALAAPAEGLELALAWTERTDDVATADAIGWLMLGPSVAALAAAGDEDALDATLDRLAGQRRPEGRRAAVAMGLAWTPERLEGPSAAALREAIGQRQLRMVEEAQSALLGPLVARFVRDDAPAVQKALRRVLRAWVDADPAAVLAWARALPGGLPRLLGSEVDRARRRA